MEKLETPDSTLQSIQQLYSELRSQTQSRWKRDLPFLELPFDRWERAENLGFGEATSIYQNSYVFGDIEVGEHTWIGPYTLLDGSGGLRIGSYCSISAGTQIYTHDTVKWALSGGKASYEHAAVSIGDNCYIGSQTIIGKGITIGDHVVVGACSFVNRDIPPYSIAAGVPCRVIGKVQISESGEVHLAYTQNEP